MLNLAQLLGLWVERNKSAQLTRSEAVATQEELTHVLQVVDNDSVERQLGVGRLGRRPDGLDVGNDDRLEMELLNHLRDVGRVAERVDKEDRSASKAASDGSSASVSLPGAGRDRQQTHGAILSMTAPAGISVTSAFVVCRQREKGSVSGVSRSGAGSARTKKNWDPRPYYVRKGGIEV